MEKLEKIYEAVEMLESLGLPVSHEQLNHIAQMEKEYLRDEVIPLIKQELEPLVNKMRNQFHLDVKYSNTGGLDIQLSENPGYSRVVNSPESTKDYRKKKYIIRVTFPNNRVSCQKMVSNTFVEVIKYAGAENVRRLGIMMLGENIISSTFFENERYAAGQHEVEPGLYVSTYCDTDRKYEILKTINRELKLNLTIEKVLYD